MAKMGRPPKDKDLLMTASVRIMLTADQKELIDQAAKLEGMDMTAWVRPILVDLARQRIAKKRQK